MRVWDPARPTRRLTDASELAVSAILEQRDDAGAFHPVAFESRKPTQPERSHPPNLLELLAAVSALKTLHVSHHQARWLNLLAESSGAAPTRPTSPPGSASPTARALPRTRATTCSTTSRLLRSWLPAPPQSPSLPARRFRGRGFALRSYRTRSRDPLAAAAQAQGGQPGGCPLHPQNTM